MRKKVGKGTSTGSSRYRRPNIKLSGRWVGQVAIGRVEARSSVDNEKAVWV